MTPCDPFGFASVLLLHFYGADGDAVTNDSSTYGWPITFGGNVGIPTISVAQQEFGPSSLQLVPPNSAGDHWVNTPVVPGSALDVISDVGGVPPDFTIEFWFYIGGPGTGVVLCDFGSSDDYSNTIGLQLACLSDPDSIGVAPSIPFWSQIEHQTVVTDDVWHHYALVRASGVVHLYLDGVQDSGLGVTDWSGFTAAPGGFVWVGSSPLVGGGGISSNSYIDEFRVSNVARYTATFVPSVTAFGQQCAPIGGDASGGFRLARAFAPVMLANASSINPKIYMPVENTTVRAK